MSLKMTLISTLLAGSMLALAGCAENPADKVPTAEVGTPAVTASASPGAATPAAKEGKVHVFAEGTTVSFEGSKVTGKHAGGFKKVEGSVTVPDGNLEMASVDLTIDMTSVWSDSEKLTGHLKAPDFFDVATFPTSTFKSTAIKKDGDGYKVSGELALHGVTQAITFPAQMSLDGDTLSTKAEFDIDRTLWGIKYPGKPDNLIRNEVVIKFDLKAQAKG